MLSALRLHPDCRVLDVPTFLWEEYTGQGRTEHNLSRGEAACKIISTIRKHPSPSKRRELIQSLHESSGLPLWRLFKMLSKKDA